MLQAERRHTKVVTDISLVRMIWLDSKRKHAKSENGGYMDTSYCLLMTLELCIGCHLKQCKQLNQDKQCQGGH